MLVGEGLPPGAWPLWHTIRAFRERVKGLGKLLYEGERLQRRTLLSDDCKYLGVAGPVTGMSLEINGGDKFSFIIPMGCIKQL